MLGLLGPFGTYLMPVGLRLAYWVGFIIIGYIIFRPVNIVGNWLSELSSIPIWATTLLTTAIASVPITVAITFAMSGMQYDGRAIGNDFAILYAQCFGIGAGIFLIMRLVFGPQQNAKAAPADAPKFHSPESLPNLTIEDSLHERLPKGFGEILALGMEDHYVRVFGKQREEMILHRFSDAVAEMDQTEGLKVHRSWWVARSAIRSSSKEGRNLRLHLADGTQVPVSRANIAKLKEAGWII